MPSIRFLASLPNEDGLYAALEKMEAADAASITILRKRSQYEPLRNLISGLWFAILYRAVERHTGCDKATRKDSRCRAIRNLTACLRAGNEISGHNNNISKTVSKRMRRTEILYRFLESALQDVIDLVNCETHPREGDVEDASTSLLSQHSRSQDELTSTYPFGFNSSYTNYSVSLEATFNKSTHPRYTVQYDSPIFIYVQSGDIHSVRALFEKGMASVYDVDPYNLGLL
ncbi:hypothetical protein BJ878DRAFT_556490 [Calycina marina]|uniref:Uncharacterized protein n=1 Tax=Calycina marina TaxID=1763456 RepID=A0A9P8CE91_9HELO|nr:hypothetical protein BJ878DRAFT_556490 [Calycina marina]